MADLKDVQAESCGLHDADDPDRSSSLSLPEDTIRAQQSPTRAGQTYTHRLLALNPDWHLPLSDTSGITATALAGPDGTYVNNPQLGLDPLAENDVSRSIGLNGAETGTASYITASSPLSGASFTLNALVQIDDLEKAKHVIATTLGGPASGQFAAEVLAGGQVRFWSDDPSGMLREILAPAGAVTQGDAFLFTIQRQSSDAAWSLRVLVNGVVVAEDPTPRTWDPIPAGTLYIGTWIENALTLDPMDGVIAHVAGWNRLLSSVELQDLARAKSIAWAENIDAGAVQQNSTLVVSVRQGGWHGKLPLTATAGGVSRFTTTASGDEVTIHAGATSGTCSYSFVDANGLTSPIRTITVDVVGAAAGISAGTFTAFQAHRVRVTGLAGWPAGRRPSRVISQGTHAHGFVRRGWKPTDNDGTWMDFQAGWRKTTSADVIRIKLDDDRELDLSYTVSHAIPAPGSGGTTRTLDQLGGADFTTWNAAIGALQNNDVLVVRARPGGEVYPQDSNTGGATSTADGVKVVAHPDDLAAGRRPRIHVKGTDFARYADEMNAGHWVVHKSLGGDHGTVWRSSATHTSLANVGCSYRTTSGKLRRCYSYTNTPGTPGAMARLTDTTYPRVAVGDAVENPANWDLYHGPGIYWNSSDNRLYIRLSPLRDGVGAVQVNKNAGLGPTPPWNWTDDNPESADPNQCQLFISSSGNENSPGNVSTNISYVLRINGTSNWTIENLDFVGGGDTIQMRSTAGVILRGCRFLGWAPPNMQDSTNQSTIGQVHSMLECESATNVLLSRCEFWGGACPWVGWDENKGRLGAYSIPQKCNLWWMQGSPDDTLGIRFLNCICDGFLTVTRPGGKPLYMKFQHCRLAYWGMDGSIVTETPGQTLEYVRCQMFEFTFAGWKGQPSPHVGTQYVGYCLLTNFRPFLHENAWWDTEISQGNQFVCGGAIVGHEQHQDCRHHFYYNNTSIGAHNHRHTRVAVLTEGSGNMSHDGSSTSIFPYNRGWNIETWLSRNNICAVRPNGSQGSSEGTTGGTSGDSHAGIVVHDNNMGRNLPSHAFSQNFNMYHRGSGMPSEGFSGAVTTLDGSGVERARNSIADVRNDTGQEQDGRIADPQFVGAWAATKLDRELHTNAFWCLQSGSPAATGGDTTHRTWRDLDFGTEISYRGNSWLGCMDPAASAVEQQVGPLGPTITD